MFQYAFQDSVSSVPFSINPFTGDITVSTDTNNTLDYDAGTQTYVFQVIHDENMAMWVPLLTLVIIPSDYSKRNRYTTILDWCRHSDYTAHQ